MNITGNNIKKSLQKRQEGLNKFIDAKYAFLLKREQIIKDIEEARNIWEKTLEQLPKQEFEQ